MEELGLLDTDTIIEHRETECMMLSSNSDEEKQPFLRKAHFLKPSSTIDEQKSKLCFDDSAKPVKGLLKVDFNGWRHPQVNWENWVDSMVLKHKSTWIKAGVYEAILSSLCRIHRNNDLVYGFASKWCSDTKSFVFPWGEATISLEDVMILGGYTVSGHPACFTPLDTETEEMKEIEDYLCEARRKISKTTAKKACQSLWMKLFTEDEAKYEHEAFLSLWLSRFVFPYACDAVGKHVFTIAIRLARGTRIALAPAVLACIYRDLALLKQDIVDSLSRQYVNKLTLWSPFHLVQIWIWERFAALRPEPDLVQHDKPRLSRWHMKSMSGDVSLDFNALGECFQWRPYTSMVENWVFPRFYREIETWVSVDPYLNVEIKSFVQCIRVSELVGFECSEQYLPHRVARQFGFDQDIPGDVARLNASPQTAWDDYGKKLLCGKTLYLPARAYESNVTAQYFKWWKESVLCQNEQHTSLKRKQYNDAPGPSGFPSIRSNSVSSVDSSNYDEITTTEVSTLKRPEDGLKEKVGVDDILVSSATCSKHSNNEQMGPAGENEEDKRTLSELFKLNETRKSDDVKRTFSDHIQIISLSSSEDDKADEKSDCYNAGGKENTNEAATQGLDRVGVNANENTCTSAHPINMEVDTNGRNMSDIPRADLEARLRFLEKEVAALKELGGYNLGVSSKN